VTKTKTPFPRLWNFPDINAMVNEQIGLALRRYLSKSQIMLSADDDGNLIAVVRAGDRYVFDKTFSVEREILKAHRQGEIDTRQKINLAEAFRRTADKLHKPKQKRPIAAKSKKQTVARGAK
jgi:hypothetical protein